MDWSYRVIEINGVEYRQNHRWLAEQLPGDRVAIDDESAFISRFGLDWNYVQRIALIRLKRDCDLTDGEVRFLGRREALKRSETGVSFCVSSLKSKLLNATIVPLILSVLIFGALSIVSTAALPLRLVFLFYAIVLIALLWLVAQSLRPWETFQRCERYRQLVALDKGPPSKREEAAAKGAEVKVSDTLRRIVRALLIDMGGKIEPYKLGGALEAALIRAGFSGPDCKTIGKHIKEALELPAE